MKHATMEERWIKWMKIGHYFGCHQMPERSFFINGYQFPVCARCSGVILSLPVSLILMKMRKLTVKCAGLFIGIMLADWTIQFLKIKESTNLRRVVSGFLGGIGIHFYYFKMIRALYQLIKRIVTSE